MRLLRRLYVRELYEKHDHGPLPPPGRRDGLRVRHVSRRGVTNRAEKRKPATRKSQGYSIRQRYRPRVAASPAHGEIVQQGAQPTKALHEDGVRARVGHPQSALGSEDLGRHHENPVLDQQSLHQIQGASRTS
jgi:hypothetical protein